MVLRRWRRWVKLLVPRVDVQALDLLDQEQDCSARRCDLNARIMLEAARPLTEDVEFLRINPGVGHASTLLLLLGSGRFGIRSATSG